MNNTGSIFNHLSNAYLCEYNTVQSFLGAKLREMIGETLT